MIGDIRRHLGVTPFVPFRIRTSDGREYPVPTLDHIYLPPSGGQIVVSDDKGEVVVLPISSISGLEPAEEADRKPTAAQPLINIAIRLICVLVGFVTFATGICLTRSLPSWVSLLLIVSGSLLQWTAKCMPPNQKLTPTPIFSDNSAVGNVRHDY